MKAGQLSKWHLGCRVNWEKIWRHDDVVTLKPFGHYWPFVWGIHWWPVDSPHKGPVKWIFYILWVSSLNKLLNKQRSLHWNAINNYSPFVRGIHWAVTERCSCRCSLFFQWVFGIFLFISASIGLMQMVDNFLVVCWSNLMVHLGNRCQVQVWF